MKIIVLIVASAALGIGIILMLVGTVNAIMYIFQGFDKQYSMGTVSALAAIPLFLFAGMSFYSIQGKQNGPK